LIAASDITIMNSAITAAHSLPESTTWRAKSGVFPARAVRCDHAKNARTIVVPTTIMIGAGDTPTTSNGADGLASSTPQLRMLLKPKLMRMTPTAERTTPKASILTSGFGSADLSLKLRRRMAAACTMSRPNARRQLIAATKPTMTNASTPAIARAEPSKPTACICCFPP